MVSLNANIIGFGCLLILELLVSTSLWATFLSVLPFHFPLPLMISDCDLLTFPFPFFGSVLMYLEIFSFSSFRFLTTVVGSRICYCLVF